MKIRVLSSAGLLATLTLTGCGPADSDPGPGGVTVEDARALDEAAAKLDADAQTPPAKAAEPETSK